MVRRYTHIEIAQLFGQVLAAGSTYRIARASRGARPNTSFSVDGITAKAQTMIAAGTDALLIKDGPNWLAYGQPATLIRETVRARRSRIIVREALKTAITILYRVDKPTLTELWIYESGIKKLLATYPVVNHPFSQATLRTHVGGVRNISGSEYNFVNAFDSLTGDVAPYISTSLASTGIDTDAEDLYTDTPQGSSASIQDPRPGFIDEGSTSGTHGSINPSTISNRVVRRTGAESSSLLIYFTPPGTYNINANLQVQNSNSTTGDSRESVASAEMRVQNIARVLEELDFNRLRVEITGSGSFSEDSFLEESNILSGWSFDADPKVTLLANSFIVRDATGNDGEVTNTATISITPALLNFRPIAYLSKTKAERFVGLHYFNPDGSIATDHFSLDTKLGIKQKVTFNYRDSLPQISTQDNLRYLLSHSSNDFSFPISSALTTTLRNRQHNLIPPGIAGNLSGNYVIEPEKNQVTFIRSTANEISNPNLANLIEQDLPEASYILWAAASEEEIRKLDPNGFFVLNF